MYIIYRNTWCKKEAVYNIKNSINNSNHCVNSDFTNTLLAAQMRSLTLAQSRVLKLSHYQSVSDIKKENKLKRIKISYS